MKNGTAQEAGSTTSEGFGERALVVSGETNPTAMAEKAKAATNARYVMALQRPRSWADVRVRLLGECKRPGFAAVARYRKPIGKGVEGPSIRFAEACMRYAGNMDVPVTTTFEDRTRRVLNVQAIDFETNASYSAELTIEKCVERRETKDRVVVGQRTNSAGEKVYIVEATEDELLNKVNAAVSKAARTLLLRLIPGDIVDEGQALCVATLKAAAAADPDGQRKTLCDAFAALGVMPRDLGEYLGHGVESIQPVELVELQAVYAAIREGDARWADAVASKRGGEKGPAGESAPKNAAADRLAEKVKARVDAAKADRKAKKKKPDTTTAPAAKAGDTNAKAEGTTEPKEDDGTLSAEAQARLEAAEKPKSS